MKQRPLPKTVTPLAGELLSGWLTRLAVTNHCEVDELLAHIGVDTRQVAMLDFGVEVTATTAGKISIAARVAERLARIKRRAVPDECFRNRGLMSKWIDGNR